MKKKDYKAMCELLSAELRRERQKARDYLVIINKLNRMNSKLEKRSMTFSKHPKTLDELVQKMNNDPELISGKDNINQSEQTIKLPDYRRPKGDISQQVSRVITDDDINSTITVVVRDSTSYKDAKLLRDIHERACDWGKLLKDNSFDPRMFVWVKEFKGKLYPKIEINIGKEEVQFELDSFLNIKETHIKTFPTINGRRIRRDISQREASNEMQKIIALIYQDEHIKIMRKDF